MKFASTYGFLVWWIKWRYRYLCHVTGSVTHSQVVGLRIEGNFVSYHFSRELQTTIGMSLPEKSVTLIFEP